MTVFSDSVIPAVHVSAIAVYVETAVTYFVLRIPFAPQNEYVCAIISTMAATAQRSVMKSQPAMDMGAAPAVGSARVPLGDMGQIVGKNVTILKIAVETAIAILKMGTVFAINTTSDRTA